MLMMFLYLRPQLAGKYEYTSLFRRGSFCLPTVPDCWMKTFGGWEEGKARERRWEG